MDRQIARDIVGLQKYMDAERKKAYGRGLAEGNSAMETELCTVKEWIRGQLLHLGRRKAGLACRLSDYERGRCDALLAARRVMEGQNETR